MNAKVRDVMTPGPIGVDYCQSIGDAARGDICSRELAVLGPDDDVEYAARLVRERAVRRLPVIAGGTPVGVVSVGDLAPGRRDPADPTVPDGIKPG